MRRFGHACGATRNKDLGVGAILTGEIAFSLVVRIPPVAESFPQIPGDHA
jgi:hypothetical protein